MVNTSDARQSEQQQVEPVPDTRAAVVARARPIAANEPRISVIINAGAGSNRAQECVEDVRRQCEALGLNAEVRPVRPGEQITDAAQEAVRAGAGVVVAGGGDGTVSAVASCLVGTDVALGVLPLGTLNHFAKDLGISTEIEAALEVIARGKVLDVDVAEVNGQVFINNSSLGLYPHIVRHREQQQRRLGRSKWRALVTATLHVLQRSHPTWVRIEVNGEQLVRRTGFIFIGNNSYEMEGLKIGERASLTGGALSLYVTRKSNRMALLRLAFRALIGRLQEAGDFDLVQAASVTVRTRHHHVRVATDGEVQVMETPLHYRIRPRELRVVVPG
jgi:YegS/Rv2252/BmrU family lipid kinase